MGITIRIFKGVRQPWLNSLKNFRTTFVLNFLRQNGHEGQDLLLWWVRLRPQVPETKGRVAL